MSKTIDILHDISEYRNLIAQLETINAELLEALKLLDWAYDGIDVEARQAAWSAARKAIAKAEGRVTPV